PDVQSHSRRDHAKRCHGGHLPSPDVRKRRRLSTRGWHIETIELAELIVCSSRRDVDLPVQTTDASGERQPTFFRQFLQKGLYLIIFGRKSFFRLSALHFLLMLGACLWFHFSFSTDHGFDSIPRIDPALRGC